MADESSTFMAPNPHDEMMKLIQATHAPDGRAFNVKSLLCIVEDILNRATQRVQDIVPATQAHAEHMEDKTHQAISIFTILDVLSFKDIDRISCEIECERLAGADANATTFSLLSILSSYSWDAKLVLTLAAFALNYGSFCLLIQTHPANQLAKSIAVLKGLPDNLEHSDPQKRQFDKLNNRIKAMLHTARFTVELQELQHMHIVENIQPFSQVMAQIPVIVCWTIWSVVDCATQISTLTGMPKYLYAEWQMRSTVYQKEPENEREEKKLSKRLDLQSLIDESDKRNAIFPEVNLPLVDGSTDKKRVNMDVLRRKDSFLLILILGLDISDEELSILKIIFSKGGGTGATKVKSKYEVVWMPIVDPAIPWTDSIQSHFEKLQSKMPWYSVESPSLMDARAIKFIKEVCHFEKSPIVVALDPQGRVVCPNAIHMMWIWGTEAFPFTRERENALWMDSRWRLELLVDGIDQTILNWINEEKYIFLYGGDDILWIVNFVFRARTVARAAGIRLEMVYIGKSNNREQVRDVIGFITSANLYCWRDLTMILFFWARLERMLFSKIRLGQADDEDPLTQGIKKLLSYDKDPGWAVLCRGSEVLINGHGTTVVSTLLEYDSWKEHVPEKGFDESLKDHHDKIHGAAHPCCHFEFPDGGTSDVPKSMKCPDCKRVMQMSITSTFKCCHD